MKAQRTVMVNIRLTEDERSQFQELAASDNRTLTSWLRHLAQKAAGRSGVRKKNGKRLTA